MRTFIGTCLLLALLCATAFGALQEGVKAKAGSRWRIDVADWNNDGKKDILMGNYSQRTGNIWVFLGK